MMTPMRRFELGTCSVDVIIITAATDVRKLLSGAEREVGSTISLKAIDAVAHDMEGDNPILLGTAFYKLGTPLVLACWCGDVHQTGQIVFHELGHVFAHWIGCDPRSEMVARVLAGLIPQATMDSIYLWLREEFYHMRPRKGKVPLTK